METEAVRSQPKKRGPVKRDYVSTHVMLPPALIDWAKEQPEGLSGLLRRILTQEHKRVETTTL